MHYLRFLQGSPIVALGFAVLPGQESDRRSSLSWLWLLLIIILIVVLIWWLLRRPKQEMPASLPTAPKMPATPPAPTLPAVAPAMPAASEPPAMVGPDMAQVGPDVALAAAAPMADDLTIVEGIGPKVAALLKEAGITTFRQLADANVGHLEELLREAGLRMMNPATWPEQARLAALGDHEGLQRLQESLKGGRRA